MKKQTTKFYGAPWCPDCRRAKQYLDKHKIIYEYINIEEVPGAVEEVERINNGYQSIPTIVFPDGEVLVEPTNDDLQKAIDANRKCIIIHKNAVQEGG